MELVEGRVRLTFDLGSGALILTSNRKYNTGVWYKITLQRNKRKGTTTMVPLLKYCRSTALYCRFYCKLSGGVAKLGDVTASAVSFQVVLLLVLLQYLVVLMLLFLMMVLCVQVTCLSWPPTNHQRKRCWRRSLLECPLT